MISLLYFYKPHPMGVRGLGGVGGGGGGSAQLWSGTPDLPASVSKCIVTPFHSVGYFEGV